MTSLRPFPERQNTGILERRLFDFTEREDTGIYRDQAVSFTETRLWVLQRQDTGIYRATRLRDFTDKTTRFYRGQSYVILQTCLWVLKEWTDYEIVERDKRRVHWATGNDISLSEKDVRLDGDKVWDYRPTQWWHVTKRECSETTKQDGEMLLNDKAMRFYTAMD